MPESAQHDMLLTMVTAIAAGVMLIIVARRFGVPSIVVLLLGGVALGPHGAGLVDPDSLGDGLLVLVAMAVGLVLFEGGLTLDVTGYRSAPRVIVRLLTIGVLTTWLGTALVLRLVGDQPARLAIVAGSLVIVTGPTVIAPMLKRIQVTARLHSILHWEGVLIDPIGVFIAVLCFEWISGAGGSQALANLGVRLGAGLAIGAAGGATVSMAVRRKLVPGDMVNVFALAGAVLIFGLAEAVRSEAGLLSVTVAGFIFGLSGSFKAKQVRQFKAELTDLLIGTLFILLAARLSFDQFATFGIRGFAAVAIVMFAIRPLSILLCSWGLDLNARERLFLGWVAPRGIVAASMASLIAISLEESGKVDDPKFVETFTYSVIIATIVIQGSTAGYLARLLGVKRPAPTGWLVIGAHALGRGIADFLAKTAGLHVVLVDTNARLIDRMRKEGFTAIEADARDTTLRERDEMQGVGNVLALTDNEDLNVRICGNWSGLVGAEHVYRCNPAGSKPSEAEEEEQGAGRILWARLPKPSLVSGELDRGEARVVTLKGSGGGEARLGTPLLAFENDRLMVEPSTTERDETAPDVRTLYLWRPADTLRRILRPELILQIDRVDDVPTLFAQLVDLVRTVHPELPREESTEDLVHRENLFRSALGHSVAVPHTACPDLKSRVCAVATIRDGVDFGAYDGEPVRLVFLLLSPPGDPEGHLATLAEIARRVADPDMRGRLIAASSPEEILRLIG